MSRSREKVNNPGSYVVLFKGNTEIQYDGKGTTTPQAVAAKLTQRLTVKKGACLYYLSRDNGPGDSPPDIHTGISFVGPRNQRYEEEPYFNGEDDRVGQDFVEAKCINPVREYRHLRLVEACATANQGVVTPDVVYVTELWANKKEPHWFNGSFHVDDELGGVGHWQSWSDYSNGLKEAIGLEKVAEIQASVPSLPELREANTALRENGLRVDVKGMSKDLKRWAKQRLRRQKHK